MLIDQIKQDQLAARKSGDKDKASILTTLYSEAANIGINDGKRSSTDSEVAAVIKKFIKGIDECLQNCDANQVVMYEAEKAVLSEYLPKQLSSDELKLILNQLFDHHSGNKSSVMRALKDMCGGRYDGKLAAEIYDSLV